LTALYWTTLFVRSVVPAGYVSSQPIMGGIIAEQLDISYEEGVVAAIGASFLNVLPFFTFGAVGLLVMMQVSSTRLVQYVAGVFIGLSVFITVLTAVVWSQRRLVRKTVLGVSRVVRSVLNLYWQSAAVQLSEDRVAARIDVFYDAVDLLSGARRRLIYAVVLAHIGAWLFAMTLYLAAEAVGATVALPVLFFVVPAVTVVGGWVPLPGNIGGAELATTGVLVAVTAMEPAVAVAVALLFRVYSYWFVLVIGGISSIALSVRFRGLEHG